MQTKHTPGPWTVRSWSDDEHYIPEVWVWDFGDSVGDSIRRLADARLIAAAPDLLAALRELMQGVYDEFSSSHPLHEAADRARSVINRATGA